MTLTAQQCRQIDILEIFVEASRLPVKRPFMPWSWFKQQRETARDRYVDERHRSMRNRRALAEVLKSDGPSVQTDRCPGCNARIELREGVSRWQHVGPEGVTCRNSRAVELFRGLPVL